MLKGLNGPRVQGSKKTSSCPWDKYVSNISCHGQALVCSFYDLVALADNLPDALPIRQVKMKRYFLRRRIYLFWTTGRHYFWHLTDKPPTNIARVFKRDVYLGFVLTFLK